MPLLLAELQDRFRAALVGFAVGDALGFPYRGLPPASAARGLSLADDFAARPRGRFAKGQFSDDTQVLLAIAESIAKARKVDGRSAAQHLSWLWQEGVILLPPPSATSAAEALLAGTPWMSAGAELGVRDPSCLSRGVVLGLWSDPAKLPHDASVLTVLTHKDPVCAAATAAVARAVSLGVSGEPVEPAAFCEQLAIAARGCDSELADEIFYLPRVLSWDPTRALGALRKIGVPPSQLELEPGIPAHVAPVLLCALYAALKVPHDVRSALNLLLRCGGEVDVAAGVCGAVLGAALGTAAIPARLKKNLLYAEAVIESADRLFDAKLTREPVRMPVLAASKR
jgi:ADP-ribosyl-[dinitrogen reductase] hydrolase